MIRFIARALTLAPVLVAALAEIAAAHPGHGTPHLLHEGDAIVSWWIVGVLGAAAALVLVFGKDRS